MLWNSLNNLILLVELHSHLAYLILFLWAVWDALFPLSFFIYWEIYFLAWAILAWYWILNIYIVSIILLIWWFIWDNISYYLGLNYWGKIISHLQKNTFFKKYLTKDNLDKIHNFVKEKWWISVLIARFSGPLSRITPFLVWIFWLKYKQFLKYDILWVIWGIWLFIVIGYFFWRNIQSIFFFFWNYFLKTILSIICVIILYKLIKKNIS